MTLLLTSCEKEAVCCAVVLRLFVSFYSPNQTGVKHREEKRETNHYKVSMQLVFLHLEREDFMAYQCVCRNTLGIADSVVRLYREFLLRSDF